MSIDPRDPDPRLAPIREQIIALESQLNRRLQQDDLAPIKEQILALEGQLGRRIQAERELVTQYQEQQRRSDDREERERERKSEVLRTGLAEMVHSGDANLLQHIEHQKEQVGQAFAASEKAIEKAEIAFRERLHDMNGFREQLNHQANTFITRDLFEQFENEARRLNAQAVDQLNRVGIRVTEIEARGGGEKDHTLDARQRSHLILVIISAVVGGIGVLTAVIVAANAAFSAGLGL